MTRKDIKITIRQKLWKKAVKKAMSEFQFVHTITDALNAILLLSLYKVRSKHRRTDNIFLSYSNVTEMTSDTYITFTIEIISELLYEAKNNNSNGTYSSIVESVLADYIVLPINFYTDNISPVYTIVGSKNSVMQKATASAIESMNLHHKQTTLVDACCATGSLYFGLNTYNWKSVILNDLNPLITNILNVIKQQPLKLIKSILSTPVFSNKKHLSEYMAEAHSFIKGYKAKRMQYHKVDCNIDIATMTFIFQCINKQYPEDKDKIFNRITKIIPASIKLQNAIITQEDCIKYLDNDMNKFMLLDVPYIGSEYTCSAKCYNYNRFHKNIAEKLYNADYPFLYYCRSTPPKAYNPYNEQDAMNIQKLKLAEYFFNKGLFFEKVYLKEDTELIISNRHYSEGQFEWSDEKQIII